MSSKKITTVQALFDRLIGEETLSLNSFTVIRGVERSVASTAKIIGSKGVRNYGFISFSFSAYEEFHKVLSTAVRSLPNSLKWRLPSPEGVELVQVRQWEPRIKGEPVQIGRRVFVPVSTFENLQKWLGGDNRIGKKGISARNKIERIVFPERFEKSKPSSSRPKPKPGGTHPPRKPSTESTISAAVKALSRYFDVIVVDVGKKQEGSESEIPASTGKMPTIQDIKELAADGEEPLDLLDEDIDECSVIWVLRDPNGFHAVLIGPGLATAHEEKVRRSFIGFRLPSMSARDLRRTNDLRPVLYRSGNVGDGWLMVTSQDRLVAGLTSLRRFCELFGLSVA